MGLSFSALEPGIAEQLAAAKLTKPAQAKQIAATLLPHRDRFLAVESVTGVPALWIMPVFYREEPSFSTYFGNGDPLSKVTTHVPRGRGPFATWEEGVVDALTLDHITSVEEWTWTRAAYQWELWNGFGPRGHGRPSGYVWAGTDQYHGGKYVHDGPGGWSPRTWDQQMGCVALARVLAAEDSALAGGFTGALTS